MGVPQAVVVRKGSQLFTRPPAPRDPEPSFLGDHLRDLLAVAFGMWPLTVVLLLGLGLVWMAGMNGAP